MTKKILIYFDKPNPRWGYLPWLLYDPLILSEVRIKPEVRIISSKGKLSYPEVSKKAISSYDLSEVGMQVFCLMIIMAEGC